MKKKVLLALCLLASLNIYAQWWSGHADNVVFDETAKTMTITGLHAGELGNIIVEDYGTSHINLRTVNNYVWTNMALDPGSYYWEAVFDPAPIETLTITGELNGIDIKLLADMGRRWISNATLATYTFNTATQPSDINYYKKKGGLKHLDISEAKILAGGDYFTVTSGNYDGASMGDYNISGQNLRSAKGLESDMTLTKTAEANKIGDYMFVGCDILESIKLPTTATEIGESAFSLMMSMEEMTIPASVEKIGSWAFWQAFNMKTIRAGVPSTIIRFEGTENKVTLEENALVQFNNEDPMIVYGGEPKKIAGVESSANLLADYALDPVIKENYEAGFVKGTVTPPNKFWTFSSGVDVVVPDGVDVYTFEIVNGEAQFHILTDTELDVDGKRVIKANNGVLLACPDGSEGNAYELVAKYNAGITAIATTNANDYANNSLVPVIRAAHYEPGEYYMLYHGKWVALASDATKVPACKALLKK